MFPEPAAGIFHQTLQVNAVFFIGQIRLYMGNDAFCSID